MNVLLTILDK